jgi:hypothetical protein
MHMPGQLQSPSTQGRYSWSGPIVARSLDAVANAPKVEASLNAARRHVDEAIERLAAIDALILQQRERGMEPPQAAELREVLNETLRNMQEHLAHLASLQSPK